MKIRKIVDGDAVADHGNSMEVVYYVALNLWNLQISVPTLFAFY